MGTKSTLVTSLASTAKKPVASASAASAAATAEAPTILPSLGSSGAIYAAVVATAFAYPTAHVSLMFTTTPAIPIQYAIGGLVLLDCVGALRGWRYVRRTVPQLHWTGFLFFI